ncbi:GDSL-type esterase/lipase family protein [Salinibacterium sp. G-O1]|uniref:GDSL-type esterase/lipase family protein n=1 Tax=Salinibacterium sp. G-O1 TaxID=3046208 RepID=UPI0024B9334C|nr:GDSL-type esterase/lipase family protein [Salinibacterium sp. G-O1]MDJ0334751.1 GDSL-type esterase/lipase family protein [Salinibacterium sp. G-O1]
MTDESFIESRPSIAFVGDSLTEGGRWADWFPDRNTHNLGIGGNTTDDVVARLDSIIELRPEAVALLIGTNDLGTRKSVEHLVRNIEFVLVTLRRALPGTRMLVQSIMPRGREFSAQIQDANRHLRQFAPSVKAQYLDLWPAFSQEDGELDPALSDDKLHLNDEGYERWLSELRPALERLDDAPPMSRPITIIRPQG